MQKKFKTRLLLVLLIITICIMHSLKAVSQTKEEFDNLVFFIPQGLTVTKSTNSMILTDATLGAGQTFSITINKSSYSLRRIEKSFPIYWKEALALDGFDNPEAEPTFVKFQNTSGWNCFRGGKAVRYSPTSTPLFYHLTVARYLGLTTLIVTKASSEDLFVQKIPLLMQMVASIEFKKQPAQNVYTSNPPNNSSGYPPASSPPANTGYGNGNPGNSTSNSALQANTLYMSVQGDLLMGNAEIAILYFLQDGSVFIDIPEKGFANFNAQEQRSKAPDVFGNYSISGNNLSITMTGASAPAIYTINADGSVQGSGGSGQVYRKMESLSNYRFEGTYIKKQENNGITINFTKDGRFTENGLIKNITPNSNVSPAPGSGTYSIMQNSMFLQYSDGHTVQLCMYMLQEDYQQGDRPSKILINNYVLTKQ